MNAMTRLQIADTLRAHGVDSVKHVESVVAALQTKASDYALLIVLESVGVADVIRCARELRSVVHAERLVTR